MVWIEFHLPLSETTHIGQAWEGGSGRLHFRSGTTIPGLQTCAEKRGHEYLFTHRRAVHILEVLTILSHILHIKYAYIHIVHIHTPITICILTDKICVHGTKAWLFCCRIQTNIFSELTELNFKGLEHRFNHYSWGLMTTVSNMSPLKEQTILYSSASVGKVSFNDIFDLKECEETGILHFRMTRIFFSLLLLTALASVYILAWNNCQF